MPPVLNSIVQFGTGIKLGT